MSEVLITGANRGIGLELVRIYRSRGWQVSAWCRHAGEDLPRTGARVIEGVDVSDPASLAAAAAEQRLPLDLLIANADNTSGGRYGYRMSKAALNAAGRSLAHDLAAQLVARIDQLDAACSGVFRHASGEVLPW